jgi:hypothetical protein
MSKKEKIVGKSKIQVKEYLTKKNIWFISLLLIDLVFVILFRGQCLNFSPVSGYNVLFIVLIILLLYPLFDTIKISPTGGLELSNKKINGKFYNKTVEKILELKLIGIKNNLVKFINKKLNQIGSIPSTGRKDQPHSRQEGLGILDDNEMDSVNIIMNEGLTNISSLDNASILIDNLAKNLIKKYENITENKKDDLDKNDEMDNIYKTLNEISKKGIVKFDDNLSIEKFNEWKDYSKILIEAVTNKTDINLYDNYCSLIDSLEETELNPYQKLNSCIDYLLDIMKLVSDTKI